MFNRIIVNITFFFIAIVFAIPGICLAKTITDEIKLNTPEYKKHTKGAVIFSHKKHTDSYNAECGDCHHDSNNKPISTLKEGDHVDRCVVCHTETGKKPKEEKLTKKDMIKKYHKAALHANCKGCHNKFNKKNNLDKGDEAAAPENCSRCHLSNKKK